MKKLFALLVIVAMLAVCAFSASAAISADEKKIIDALSEEIKMASGTVVSLPDRYINQAEDYLTKADLTPAQVNEILEYIGNAQDVVEESDAKSLSVAADAVKSAVVVEAQKAAEVINAELSVTKLGTTGEQGQVNANYKVTLVFNANSTVDGYEEGDKIELTVKSDEITQTGVEGSVVSTIVVCVVLLSAAAFVVIASRKRALSK